MISSTNSELNENRLYHERNNVINTPLINTEKFYLPSLQSKREFIKYFFKTMDQNSAGFMNLKTKCPTMSDAKIKEGIFVGLQIQELIQDVKYKDQLSELKRATWDILKNGTTIFFLGGGGIIRQKKYRDMMANLVKSYKAM